VSAAIPGSGSREFTVDDLPERHALRVITEPSNKGSKQANAAAGGPAALLHLAWDHLLTEEPFESHQPRQWLATPYF
jgi:hypothetical protein